MSKSRLAKTILVTLTLVTFTLPITGQAVAPYSWSSEALFTVSDPGSAPVTMWLPVDGNGDKVILGAQDALASNDNFIAFRSSDNGETYLQNIPASVGSLGEENDIRFVSNSVIIGCDWEQSADAIIFVRSGNSGGSWSTSTALDTANALQGCSITSFNGFTYLITFEDQTANTLKGIISTNSGSTWGAAFQIGTDDVENAQTGGRVIDVASANSTDAIVVYPVETTRVAKACRTSNAGSSWTCAQISSVVTDVVRIEHISGDDYVFLGTDKTSDTTTVCETFDNGATWGCNTLPSFPSVENSAIWPVNDTYWIAAVMRDTNTDDTTPTKFTETLDAGISWSAYETVDTLIASTGATNEQVLGASGIVGGLSILASGNKAHIYYSYKPGTGSSNLDVIIRHAKATITASEAIGADATATVTGLTGFDVDTAGGIAIARTDDVSDQSVSIFNAQTLGTPVGGPITTNCGAGTNDYEDGVMAKNTFRGGNDAVLVAFLNCDANGDAQYLSIRETNGDVPVSDDFKDSDDETCTPGDGVTQCPYNIDLAQFGGDAVDNALGMMGQVQDFPIDYSHNIESFGADHREVAWAFASQQCDSPPGPSFCSGTEPGFVGVAAYTASTAITGGADAWRDDDVQHHPTQSVDDFCLGLDGSSYYLASVVPGQPGHTWPVSFDERFGDTFTLGVDVQPFSGTFGNSGSGIDCGGGQIIMLDGNGTVQLLTRTGVFLDIVPSVTGEIRGVAITEEFFGPNSSITNRGLTCTTALEDTNGCVQYGSWVDDGTIYFANLTGGQFQISEFTVEVPSGTFHSMIMDRTGQGLWVATSTTIAHFPIIPATTVIPINSRNGDGEGDGDGGGGGGGDGDISGAVDEFIQSNLALALILIIVLAIMGAAVSSRWDMSIGASIGAALGVVISAAPPLNWIPPLSILLGVLLVGGIFAWRKR